VEVKLHLFLALAIYGGEFQSHAAALYAVYCVCAGFGVDVLEKRKNLLPLSGFEPPVVQVVV
jgi:hypothetical protein